MDSHDYNVFTGVKIEIFFMGFYQIFSVCKYRKCVVGIKHFYMLNLFV